jgi:uncharacterized membrane protein YeaQ/YmgE (transglycosylase-associated protein family)
VGILAWVVLGLVVGVLARWLMPGDDPAGLVMTVLLGVAGAFVGGAISSALGFGSVDGLNLGSVLIATAGAVLLLLAYRGLRGRRRG